MTYLNIPCSLIICNPSHPNTKSGVGEIIIESGKLLISRRTIPSCFFIMYVRAKNNKTKIIHEIFQKGFPQNKEAVPFLGLFILIHNNHLYKNYKSLSL